MSRNEFAARGGWWVVAQVPVMLGAALAPLLWGARSFDGTNAIQVAGASVTALGILLGLAGLATLGRALTPFPRPLDHAHLRQSGVYGLDVVRKRPNLVRALISIEGGCETVTPADIASPFVKVPFVSVWGDNSVGAAGVNGDARREGCSRAVSLIKGGGGRATFLLLPDAGLPGNSHMLMMDKNNLVIAEVLRKWVGDNVR